MAKVSAQDTVGNQPYLCREWKKSKGNCSYGTQCRFLHPELDLTLDLQVARKDRTKNDRGKTKRIRKKNKQKNKQFCYWLAHEFGIELLQSGLGVLDVAGGRGEISFILNNVLQISSSIIDPRDKIDYSTFITKLKSGNYRSFNQEEVSKLNLTNNIPDDIVIPNHIKLFFTPILWELLRMDSKETCNKQNYDKEYITFLENKQEAFTNVDEFFSKLVNEAKACWNPKTLLNSKIQIESSTEESSISIFEVQSLLENCSCIIGMHPDQATEAIVDYALLTNKPFAIIPCCVCSKQYPNRIFNDSLVSNYSDFIEYLKSKHEDIQVSTLPFEGKNTVLFWHPNKS